MTQVLVCGGAAFRDWRLLYRFLGEVQTALSDKPIVITWGESRGASALARKWARENGCVWIENLFVNIDLVVAFPGANTAKPLQHAWRRRIPAIRVFADGSYTWVGKPARIFRVVRARRPNA
jgi:hypothetical protein